MYYLNKLISRYKHWKLALQGAQVFVHPSAHLHRKFCIRFLSKPEQRPYVKIGERTMLNLSIIFESRQGYVEIGDRAYIGAGTQIICRDRVLLGKDVVVAWNVTFYDHNSHSLAAAQRKSVVSHFYDSYGKADCYDMLDWTDVASAPIVIEDNVWIGFDAVILKGVTIGKGAIVAARSVVTRDVEPYTVVAGNPAVLVKRLDNNGMDGNVR